MKNNNIKTIVIATSTVLLLSACGGGGSKDTPKTPAEQTGNIVKCDTNTHSALKKNDKITALQDATEVKVRHNEDGTREACVTKGEAKIN